MLANLKIAARLLIGFGSLTVLIAGLSSFSYYQADTTEVAVSDLVLLKNNEVLNQRAQKYIIDGRLAVWLAIGTGDKTQWDKAAASFKLAGERLDDIAARTLDPQRIAWAKELKGLLGTYVSQSAPKLRTFKEGGGALESADGKKVVDEALSMAARMNQLADSISNSFATAGDGRIAEVNKRLALALQTALIVGIASLLLGLGLAFLVTRSIVQPIAKMTGAMGSLAKGDVATVVQDTDNRSEIGDMARAVQVFKDNMIETNRLRDEQEALKASTETEKRASMNRLADEFNASVKGVVGKVSTASAGLQQTAQAMSATAEETSRQATVVSAAAEQASTNVQTVASASEELFASISEISRQVATSARIAGQAVEQADRTNAQVDGLAKAAQKIGEVVQLINDIAAQTNLLALNATIEAARAGEAGKGFAVVASEVKSLATQTAKATEDIAQQISVIQSATQEAVGAIQDIGKTIGEINQITTTVASAVEEQGAATQEIARNVQQAAVGTSEVTVNITGVNQAATQTGAAAGRVLTSAGDLAAQGDLLRRQVDDFIAKVRTA
ncbi:methyl-accepting chemotaxis protein [Lacibacterium aquatile]|uniref:Methyl-accepting chemotaxis protein n=1 Tax=Lacibacterium aquatile TaxID=1168082 RepID=A0ABW5DVA1_9PROT